MSGEELSREKVGAVKKNVKIAISGKSGCGNTTITSLTAERLGLRFINFTFRNLARENNMPLEEVLHLAEIDDYWDKTVDRRQIEAALSDDERGCVLGSRLAIWLLKDADLKVYLKGDTDVRTRRLMAREGGSFEEVAAFTKERDTRDHARYLRLYNIDNDDYAFADLIIDTNLYTPDEIVSQIINWYRIYAGLTVPQAR
ncbi:MAG: cytidylate kinase family protein [Spirochaetaceae bacterium]|jgi:cytidylate kinase|nr:cytidylate kinase family protein [Spirochaetaceae bacterium]